MVNGNDTYYIRRTSGRDDIFNYDTDSGTDQIDFSYDNDITKMDIWFERGTGENVNDVIIKILGTSTEASVKGWYDVSGNPDPNFVIDLVGATDGISIDIDGLIVVMAAYKAANPTFIPSEAVGGMPSSIRADVELLYIANTPPEVTGLLTSKVISEDSGLATVTFNVSDAQSEADTLSIIEITSGDETLINSAGIIPREY